MRRSDGITCEVHLRQLVLNGTTATVTELLAQAITELGKLSAEDQDAIASRILAEIADEQEWTTRFNETTDEQWDRLSELARQEIRAGDTD